MPVSSRATAALTVLVATTLTIPPRLAAQAADTSYFVTTNDQGDTLAVEQSVYDGRTITGEWIQRQGGGLFPHYYALVLGADERPTMLSFQLYTSAPHTYLLNETWEPDSNTQIVVANDRVTTRRFAASSAIPITFGSMAGWDLVLRTARRAKSDSASIMREPAHTAMTVRFIGADSAAVGDLRMHVAPDGSLLGLRAGTFEVQRVQSEVRLR